MQSTLNPTQDDPHDVLVLERDVVQALAGREKPPQEPSIGPPSDRQAPAFSEFAAASRVPPVDTSFRATATNAAASNKVNVPSGAPSVGRRAVLGIAGLVVAICIGVAGAAWQAYGEAARQFVARWIPPSVSTRAPLDNPGVAQQASQPAAEASTATTQAAPVGQTPGEDAASTAATASAEPGPLLQSVARDLATMSQQVEELKSSIAELKANQAQISRDVAKVSDKASEPSPRPRISMPPTSASASRPLAPTRRPASLSRPPQAAAGAPLAPPTSYVPPQAAARYAPPPAAPYVAPPAAAVYVPRQVEPPPQAAVSPPDPDVPRPPMPMRDRFPD